MYQKRNNELEVIDLYRGNYKARFYLRQISKLSKLPLKTCQNALIKLEKNKILKGKTEGRNKYFILNIDNIQAKSLILQSEIYKTSKFIDDCPQFKTFLKSLNTNIPVILFGSFAKLREEKKSDIDMLVISEKETNLPSHLLSNKIHKINLSESSFKKAIEEKETIIEEIEENHIILNNHSFYVNVMWNHYGKR